MLMNAKVTIEFDCKNMYDTEDLPCNGIETGEQLIQYLIEEDGIMSICEDEFKIVKIQLYPEKK